MQLCLPSARGPTVNPQTLADLRRIGRQTEASNINVTTTPAEAAAAIASRAETRPSITAGRRLSAQSPSRDLQPRRRPRLHPSLHLQSPNQ